MPSMIVHDRRLKGKPPAGYNYVLQVNEHTSIQHIIQTVAHYGKMKKLSPLHILCHGFEADWNLRQRICTPANHGGFGLLLGTENLTLYNVNKLTAWRGLIDVIVLFACAPADTGPGNAGTRGDGRRLLGEMALWTDARVIGARDTQFYNDATGKKTIDFGAWEGPVYEFSPGQPYGDLVGNPSPYRLRA